MSDLDTSLLLRLSLADHGRFRRLHVAASSKQAHGSGALVRLRLRLTVRFTDLVCFKFNGDLRVFPRGRQERTDTERAGILWFKGAGGLAY